MCVCVCVCENHVSIYETYELNETGIGLWDYVGW